MMREKIEEILSRTNVSADEIDALLAAIGDGQDELAKRLHYPECWDTACYETLHDALMEVTGSCGCSTCKPAPDVAAMHARIAELERVQGVLVDALEQINHSMKQAKVLGNDVRRELNLSEGLATSALAEVKKPAQQPMRKVYLVPRDDGSMEQLDHRPHGCGPDDCTVAYVPAQKPALFNGLTEEQTTASASVSGLSAQKTYYDAAGTLRNPNGSRSIFDDVDACYGCGLTPAQRERQANPEPCPDCAAQQPEGGDRD